MNDSASKTTTSCLAVVEKQTHHHRSGGRAGIFFQLFDWKRKLAKEKLFSRKLFPQARAKQASDSFTKLQLITDEKSGGFTSKKHSNIMDLEHKNEMRAPGLVARLMGLETLPAVREKTKKTSLCDAYEDNNFSNNNYTRFFMNSTNTAPTSIPTPFNIHGAYQTTVNHMIQSW